MYLSRLYLNPTRVTTRKMVASPQVTHALVLGSLPPDMPSDGMPGSSGGGAGGGTPRSVGEGRVLWRMDSEDSRIALYVASPARPDFTGMVEQAGWPTAATWDTRDYDPFLESLTAGSRWRFRLTANPAYSVSRGQGSRGHVKPHRTIGHQMEWFTGMTDRLGIALPLDEWKLPSVAIRQRTALNFPRTSERDGVRHTDRVALTTATYDGVLDIIDVPLLRTALVNGVGRARGYGCGLLTLAPP